MFNALQRFKNLIEKRFPTLVTQVLDPSANAPETKYWTYPHPRIIICQSGELHFKREKASGPDDQFHLKPGEALFVDSGCYVKRVGQYDFCYDEIHLEPSSFFVSSFISENGEIHNKLYSQDLPINKIIEIENQLELLRQEPAHDNAHLFRMKLGQLAGLVLISLCESLEPAGERQDNGKSSATFRTAVTYIDGNYCFEITRKLVAEELCVSEGHITYLFKKWTGQSFKDFLNMIRMEEFRRQLIGNGVKIREVYKNFGIKDANYFTQIFRRLYGISSRELKNWALNEPENQEKGIYCNQTNGFTELLPVTKPVPVNLEKPESTRTVFFVNLTNTPCRVFTDATEDKRLRLLTVHPFERRWTLCAEGQNIYIEKGSEEQFFVGSDSPGIIFVK